MRRQPVHQWMPPHASFTSTPVSRPYLDGRITVGKIGRRRHPSTKLSIANGRDIPTGQAYNVNAILSKQRICYHIRLKARHTQSQNLRNGFLIHQWALTVTSCTLLTKVCQAVVLLYDICCLPVAVSHSTLMNYSHAFEQNFSCDCRPAILANVVYSRKRYHCTFVLFTEVRQHAPKSYCNCSPL